MSPTAFSSLFSSPMSSKVVPKILEELYEVQPSLRERESELITIIEAIQEQQQTLAIDSTFRETLRLKLLEEAKNITVKQKPYSIHWSQFFAFASTIYVSLFIGIVAWNTFFSITPLSQRDPDRSISVSESVSDGTNMMKSRMMHAPQADLSPSLPNDACPIENYRNHKSTESMMTPYREYST